VGPDGSIYATDKGICGGQQDGSVGDNSIHRINPTTGVVSTFTTDPNAKSLFSITSDSQYLWVAGMHSCGTQTCGKNGQLDRISLADGSSVVMDSDPPATANDGTPSVTPRNAMASAGSYLYTDGGLGLRRYNKADGTWITIAGSGSSGYADGIGNSSWGAQVWGQGAAGAEALTGARTAAQLQQIGLSVENASVLRAFYQAAAAAAAGKGGPAAPARVQLLNDIIETLGG